VCKKYNYSEKETDDFLATSGETKHLYQSPTVDMSMVTTDFYYPFTHDSLISTVLILKLTLCFPEVWNGITGSEELSLQHNHIVKTVNFSDDSKYLATGSNDKIIRIFDLEKSNEGPKVNNCN